MKTVGIWVVAVIGAIAYGELVYDWRIWRSNQSISHAVSVTYSLSVATYNRNAAERVQKYGEGVKTSLALDTGIVEVNLDGKIVETYQEQKTLEGVYGLLAIWSRNGTVSTRFPFSLAANQNLARLDLTVADQLRNRFKQPKAWFEFSDKDWTIDRCETLPSGLGLGAVGDMLRLREGTACVVTWKGPQPASMLISVNRADGDPWMRPFAGRICRGITQAALQRFDPAAPGSPKYAACILADRPGYASARQSLALRVYSVGAGNTLAWMEELPP
jgi:hypothetical protein